MNFFPIRRPTVGLCIRAHTASLVELGRDWRTGWRTRRVRRAVERPLPHGLVKPSASEPNITDMARLADELRMLLDRSGPTAVVLALPDACARTVLFDFDTLPVKPAECEALMRWRFQKELNVPAEASRLAYRVFRLDAQKPSGPARVLATAIRRPIIEQYEQVCERAALVPVRMGLTSLSLFDFCRPVMEQAIRQRHSPPPEALFFAVLADDGFTLLALRDGIPLFVRMKGRNGNGGASALLPRASLADELVASLHFFDESLSDGRAANACEGPRARPLFLAGNGAEPLIEAGVASTLGVQVTPLTWQAFPAWQAPQGDTSPVSTLCAAAGLFAA